MFLQTINFIKTSKLIQVDKGLRWEHDISFSRDIHEYYGFLNKSLKGFEVFILM